MQRTLGKRLTFIIVGAALAFAALGGAGLAAVASKPSSSGAQTTSTSTTSTATNAAQKTTICHKGKVTLHISVNAVAAHQKRHGDTLGGCTASAGANAGKAKSGTSDESAGKDEEEGGKAGKAGDDDADDDD